MWIMSYRIFLRIFLRHFYSAQAGADPLKANDYGHTPLEYARHGDGGKFSYYLILNLEIVVLMQQILVFGLPSYFN